MKITNNLLSILLMLVTLLPRQLISQVSVLPNDLSGLKLWLKADGNINKSANNVIDWTDESSNSYSFSQSSPVNQPLYVATPLPHVKFSGNQILFSNSNFSFGNASIFILASQASNDVAYGRFIDHDFANGFWIGRNNGISEIGGGFAETNGPFGNFAPYNNDSLFVYTLVRKQDSAKSYINSVNFSTLSRVTSSAQTQSNPISIGGAINGQFLGSKNIYEIIIFDRDLSNSEKISVETYLYKKYILPITLPNDITIINSYCDTTIIPIIPNNNQYFSYEWSNGATTPTISVNKSGKYWLNATNIFGKVSSDTILVSFPDYHQPLKNVICKNNTLLWNTNLPKNQYSFQWQDNSTDSTFNITQAGNYCVKITDSFGCSITTDTVKIIEDNFATTTSLGPDISLCSGNSITLASGASPTNTYTWSTGSNNDSLLINNTGQYFVIVTNTNNCVVKDTIDVTVLGPAPTAQFNFSTGCKNRVVAFTNTSTAPAGNTINQVVWHFGDVLSPTNTSTLTNPFHTYADTGLYTIKLTVYTTVGCQQTYKKTIHIAPTPTVNFASSVACQNDSTAFSNQSLGSTSYSVSSIIWNFSDPASGANTSNLQLPKHLFSNQGLYPVKLIAINTAGCKDSLTKIITVNGQVKADFSYSPACFNSPTVFQDNSIVPNSPAYLRTWNISGTTATGTLVSKTFATTGVYSVTLALTSATSGTNTCASKIVKQINVFFAPIVSFSLSPFCSNDTSIFVNSSISQSGIISNYNWKLNNSTFSAIKNPTITATNAGSYPVKLIVTNSFGCKDSATNLITVLPLPTISYSTNPSPYLYINTPVTFFPSITNGNYYNWVFTNIGNYAIQNPTVNFSSIGTYTVTLTIKDNQNCKNTKTSTFNVIKRYLDLAILDVKPEKTATNYMVVKTDLANFGSIPITNFDINYTVNNGGNIIESWNGALNPGNILNYNFTAKTVLNSADVDNITCVTIQSVNFVSDENSSNNNDCKALNTGNISVLDPYPNPTTGNITLPIILDKETDYRIEIYNSIGQVTSQEVIKTGILGLNLVTVDTQNYVRGCFVLKISINDKIYIKKFLKLNKD